MDLHRVVARFLEAYKRPKNMIPVVNKDTGRTVYVLPETVKEEAGLYQKIPETRQDTRGKPSSPRRPGQPALPQKPKKPHKPEIPRATTPAPIHPPIPPKPPLDPKKPKPVKPVQPPKPPLLKEDRAKRKLKKYLKQGDTMADRILEKFLADPQDPGV